MDQPTEQPTAGEAERWVADLAERVPHVEPPYAALLAAGHVAARHRRRRRTVVAALAAAAAVIAVLVVPPIVARDAHHRPAPGPVAPVVPPGMKLVGADGVAIAVPQSWDEVLGCGGRPPLLLMQQTGTCVLTGTPPSSLTIERPGSTDAAPYPTTSRRDLGTSRVLTVASSCSGSAVCDAYLRISGLPLVIHVYLFGSDSASLLATLIGSVQLLSSVYTTVPSWPVTGADRASYATSVAAAGLRARFGVVDAAAPQTTTPAQGAVVRSGTTVLIGDAVTAAPPGMTYVGAGDAAIAVPSAWRRVSAYDAFCGRVSKPYLDIADRASTASCPALPGGTPRLPHLDVRAFGVTAGTELPEPGDRPSCASGECTAVWWLARVSFTVTVPGAPAAARAVIARIGRTLVSMPSGMAAVPLWPTGRSRTAYSSDLRATGLAPAAGPLAPDDPTRTTPDQGRVVPLDTRVYLGRPVPGTVAPAGTRYVGLDGYEVAVPSAWATVRDGGCGSAPKHSVVLSDPVLDRVVLGCPLGSRVGGRSLRVSTSSGAPRQDVVDRRVVAGVRVVETRFCHRDRCTRAWVVGGRVGFELTTVRGRGERLARRIGATLTAIPRGYVAVPVWPSRSRPTGSTSFTTGLTSARVYASILRRAGLRPVGSVSGTVGRAAPVGGTVVPVGTTVRVPGLEG